MESWMPAFAGMTTFFEISHKEKRAEPFDPTRSSNPIKPAST
jgi:hypothetical protein